MIKMKKSDLVIAFALIALILGAVLAGLAACTNPIDGIDLGGGSSTVDGGAVWIGDGSSGPGSVPVTGVSLDKNTLDLVVDDTEQLTATVLPTSATNQAVNWTVTSGSAYATVSSSGLVTGVAAGTATVTVTTVDGSHTATCTVTVIPPQTGAQTPVITLYWDWGTTSNSGTPIPNGGTINWSGVPGGAYSQYKNKMVKAVFSDAPGGYEYLQWSFNAPDQTALGKTSDNKLEFTDGFSSRTANESTATIRQYTDLGDTEQKVYVYNVDSSGARPPDTKDRYSAYFVLNATVLTVPVTSVTVSPKTLKLEVGKSAALSADVQPPDATYPTVSWTVTSGSDYATVDPVTGTVTTVTGVAPGQTVITATAGGKSDTCTVTVTQPTITLYWGWDMSSNTGTPIPNGDTITWPGAPEDAHYQSKNKMVKADFSDAPGGYEYLQWSFNAPDQTASGKTEDSKLEFTTGFYPTYPLKANESTATIMQYTDLGNKIGQKVYVYNVDSSGARPPDTKDRYSAYFVLDATVPTSTQAPVIIIIDGTYDETTKTLIRLLRRGSDNKTAPVSVSITGETGGFDYLDWDFDPPNGTDTQGLITLNNRPGTTGPWPLGKGGSAYNMSISATGIVQEVKIKVWNCDSSGTPATGAHSVKDTFTVEVG
jgi:uncharacterized protein YjdB